MLYLLVKGYMRDAKHIYFNLFRPFLIGQTSDFKTSMRYYSIGKGLERVSMFQRESTKIEKRPNLTKAIDPEVFKEFYWDKKELMSFCSAYGLSSKGGKIDLSRRIELFLRTGEVENPEEIVRTGCWDSEKKLTRNTPVNNYKNDAKTKSFFQKEIGPHFHFNSYLRQFAKAPNKDKSLTYGDLVDGWFTEETKKKDPKFKSTIGKQFEYNQFQRDFYAAQKGKTREQFIEAWKLVRSVPGAATYEHYLELMGKKQSCDGVKVCQRTQKDDNQTKKIEKKPDSTEYESLSQTGDKCKQICSELQEFSDKRDRQLTRIPPDGDKEKQSLLFDAFKGKDDKLLKRKQRPDSDQKNVTEAGGSRKKAKFE